MGTPDRTSERRLGGWATPAGVLLLLAVTGCGPSVVVQAVPAQPGTIGRGPAQQGPAHRAMSSPVPPAVPAPAAPPAAATGVARTSAALTLLPSLVVAGRGPRAGYDRLHYGQAWADTDRNGCDTRNDVLRRDLTDLSVEPGTQGCVILAGTLADRYTGAAIRFSRGGASEVDVDHVVALSDSWQKGAAQWPFAKRQAFSNDPLNLLAADASANRSKADSDAASWLPPHKAFRCAYVARQVAVKSRYGVRVTAAERDAMARVLVHCPGEPAPAGTAPTSSPIAVSGRSRPAPPAPAPPPSVPPGAPGVGDDPRFATCKAAVAAGYGPYTRSTDPEYEHYRDGDSDGVVCE